MSNDTIQELELVNQPIDEIAAEVMADWISSIHFDAPVLDWKEGDTWGDPTVEYVPPEYLQYATVDDGSGEDSGEELLEGSTNEIDLPREKSGTAWGAQRAWIKRRRMIQDKLSSAVSSRDARATIRAQRQIESGDTIYKSIEDILELIDYEQ